MGLAGWVWHHGMAVKTAQIGFGVLISIIGYPLIQTLNRGGYPRTT
jgi:hypothetical protein